jgi:hypothetical protein
MFQTGCACLLSILTRGNSLDKFVMSVGTFNSVPARGSGGQAALGSAKTKTSGNPHRDGTIAPTTTGTTVEVLT